MASTSSKKKCDQPSRASASTYSKEKMDGLSRFNSFSDRVAATEIVFDARLSCYPRILFEGYDTSVAIHSIEYAVTEHFKPCGEIYYTAVENDPLNPRRLMRYGYVYFEEESAQKMAVTLSGTVVKGGVEKKSGGWKVHVREVPKKESPPPELVAESRRLLNSSQCGFRISGYDTSLPADVVRKILFEHFSSCGEIIYLSVEEDPSQPGFLKRYGFIRLLGDDALDKAMQLSGRDLGGWKVVVHTQPKPLPMELSAFPTLGFDDPPGSKGKKGAAWVLAVVSAISKTTGSMAIPEGAETELLGDAPSGYI